MATPTLVDCCGACGSDLVVAASNSLVRCVDCGKKTKPACFRFVGMRQLGKWFSILRDQTGNLFVKCPGCGKRQWVLGTKTMAMCCLSACEHLFPVLKNLVKEGEM